jgi:hypothetical protein
VDLAPKLEQSAGGFAYGNRGAYRGRRRRGRVKPFVVLSCVVAGSGGVLFGYDLGISGTSWVLTSAAAKDFSFFLSLCQLRLSSCFFFSLLVNMSY